LEPHPHVPILATSGLDDDVKIWIPSNEDTPALANLKQVIAKRGAVIFIIMGNGSF
jgi:DDB1- and CUL4-associated factor 8